MQPSTQCDAIPYLNFYEVMMQDPMSQDPPPHADQLHVLYFASLRDALGCDHETLPRPPHCHTVSDLLHHLCLRGVVWDDALRSTRHYRIAVNQRMADVNTILPARAEVAFFPPVTGG